MYRPRGPNRATAVRVRWLPLALCAACAMRPVGGGQVVSPGWEVGHDAVSDAWADPQAPVFIHWTPPGTGGTDNVTDWVKTLYDKGYKPDRPCLLPARYDAIPRHKPVLEVPRAPPGSRRIAWFFIVGYNPSPGYEDMIKAAVLSARLKAPNLEPYFMYVMSPTERQHFHEGGGVEGTEFTAWIASLGVRIKPHTVTFYDRPGLNKQQASGAQWGRLDLFSFTQHMVPEFKARGLLTTHVLYTDMDVFFAHALPLPGGSGMFAGLPDPHKAGNKQPTTRTRAKRAPVPPGPVTDTPDDSDESDDPNVWRLDRRLFDGGALRSCGSAAKVHNEPRGWSRCLPAKGHIVGELHSSASQDPNWPYLFGAGTEVFAGWAMNSGVMYINIANTSQFHKPLVDFAATKQFRFATADQMCMEVFFKGKDDFGNGKHAWDWLNDAVVNSRGFLGPNDFMADRKNSRSALWHWHGYKAFQIRCLFDRIKDGSWDVRTGGVHGPQHKEDVPGCTIVKGNGKFPYALTGCYLSTYAWMLEQHDTLQALVDTMSVHATNPLEE